MSAFFKRFARDSSGAVLVEAAIVLPVLVTLGFLTFEFSNVFFEHQIVTSGVRDAARYLARVTDPANAAAQSNAKQLAVYGDIGGSTPRVTGWTVGNVSVALARVPNPVDSATGAPDYRGPNPLYIVTVTSTFTYSQIGVLTAFGFTLPKVEVSHSERSIGG